MNKEVFKIEQIKFVKVRVFPPQLDDFYQLFKDNVATDIVVSSSRLYDCLTSLDYEGTNNN